MLIFIALSVVSLIFYVFFKAKAFRTHRPAERDWVNTKCKMWLGSFVLFYGLNVLFSLNSTVSVVIGAIFVGIGSLYIFVNFRHYKILRAVVLEEIQKAH